MDAAKFVDALFTTNVPYFARLYKWWQAGKVNWYPYSPQAEWNTLAASAVAALPSTPITIDAESDLILMAMNFVAYPTSADPTTLNTPIPRPNMLLNITEKSGSQLYADGAHHVGLWTGCGQGSSESYVLPFPRRIVGSNTILTALTDNAGTVTHCWLGFEGVKIEYPGIDRQSVWGPQE